MDNIKMDNIEISNEIESTDGELTVEMFKMWIAGVEEMQRDDWHPTKTQWKVIRQKISMLIDSVESGSAASHLEPTIIPQYMPPTTAVPNWNGAAPMLPQYAPPTSTSAFGGGVIDANDYAARSMELEAEANKMRALDERIAEIKKSGI